MTDFPENEYHVVNVLHEVDRSKHSREAQTSASWGHFFKKTLYFPLSGCSECIKKRLTKAVNRFNNIQISGLTSVVVFTGKTEI